MGKYLDIIRRAEAEREGYDKNDLNDRSTLPRSHKADTPEIQSAPVAKVESVCVQCGGEGGDLWHLDTPSGPVLVHQECARFLPKGERAQSGLGYEASSPDCHVQIVEIPKDAGRYKRTFTFLQLRCPTYIPEDRWRTAVSDGHAFLRQWAQQAQALNWSSADLFGLHAPPANPHPAYCRLSRYDAAGLCWLLQGRKVVALTEATATIQNPDTKAITTYRRFNKPSYGPLGDSPEDVK